MRFDLHRPDQDNLHKRGAAGERAQTTEHEKVEAELTLER